MSMIVLMVSYVQSELNTPLSYVEKETFASAESLKYVMLENINLVKVMLIVSTVRPVWNAFLIKLLRMFENVHQGTFALAEKASHALLVLIVISPLVKIKVLNVNRKFLSPIS